MAAPSAAATATAMATTTTTSASDAAAAGYNRSACTECQRRKQKCNREWPCDRCQRRKIANECWYNCSTNTQPNHLNSNANTASVSLSYHVGLSQDKNPPRDDAVSSLAARVDSKAAAADAPGFDALAAARLFTTLGITSKAKPSKAAPKEDLAASDSSPQMGRLLELMPQRQTMDKLMNMFTHDVNYHYYIIYPPDFLRDYHIWWERQSKGKPLGLQYTCLLAMICACCVQHADNDVQRELHQASGLGAEDLSEQLHCAVRELASVIPVGHYHMFNVQRLLHSCYWYKAEARFLEAWHVLSAAILEGKELGYHREPPPGTETDHECEMRRRLWCILDTWDWQISSGLSRPKIIDRDDSNSELPSLTLERFSSHAPSPLLHMKMQSELTRELAKRFSAPKNIINVREVQEYQALIEAWMRKFPPVYHFEKPDLSRDAQYPWIFPHRYYVYTMACLLILNPIRHYMVRSYRPDSPPEELGVRETGVYYSLKLLRTLRSWVDRIYNRDGRLHFVVFSIFDTAAILCTAIIKDSEHTLAERDRILEAVHDAVAMLQRLNAISKTSRTSYELLERLVRRLPSTAAPARPHHSRKKARVAALAAGPATATGTMAAAEGAPSAVNAAAAAAANAAAVVTNAAAAAVGTAAAAGGYGGPVGDPFDVPLPPPPRPVLRSNYVLCDGRASASNPSLPLNGGGGPVSDDQAPSDYSVCSDGTPPRMDDHMLSTVSDLGGVAVHGLVQPVFGDASNLPPRVPDEAADFELETVTQAQLGELAPLWNWHSENLDLANMAAGGGMVGPVYVRPPA